MIVHHASLSFSMKMAPLTNVEAVILHHAGKEGCDLHSLHQLEKHGFRYNYFIDETGAIFEGRGYHEGAHTKGYDRKSIGICFSGDFDQRPPHPCQWEAGILLVSNLLFCHDLSPVDVYGHHEVRDRTTCPGLFFDLDVFREKINKTT